MFPAQSATSVNRSATGVVLRLRSVIMATIGIPPVVFVWGRSTSAPRTDASRVGAVRPDLRRAAPAHACRFELKRRFVPRGHRRTLHCRCAEARTNQETGGRQVARQGSDSIGFSLRKPNHKISNVGVWRTHLTGEGGPNKVNAAPVWNPVIITQFFWLSPYIHAFIDHSWSYKPLSFGSAPLPKREWPRQSS